MRIELDYEYYREIYGGTKIKEQEFKVYAVKSEAVVNELTFNRIRKYDLSESDEQLVKMAICAAADEFYINRKRDGIQSEDNDGFKVTYDTSKTVLDRARAEGRMFLSSTSLMNMGVNYEYKC